MKINQILKTIFLLLLILFFIFILTTCQNTKNSETDFLISYTDAFGYTSHISKIPNTIISLSPNTTEVLCALGLENKLVGVTDYCDYPTSVASIKKIGSITEPNTEQIVSLSPDLIITDGMQTKEFISNLRNLGLTVVIVRANENLDGTFTILNDIGKVTNTEDKAHEIIQNMKTELAKIKNVVDSIPNKKSIYYSISISESGLYTAGENTYINELLSLAGLENIATDMDGWTYSIEKLVEHNPDIIICSNLYDSKKSLLNYTPIKDLSAIKNNSIIEIDDNLISRQTPRNIEGIKYLIELIYEIKID